MKRHLWNVHTALRASVYLSKAQHGTNNVTANQILWYQILHANWNETAVFICGIICSRNIHLLSFHSSTLCFRYGKSRVFHLRDLIPFIYAPWRTGSYNTERWTDTWSALHLSVLLCSSHKGTISWTSAQCQSCWLSSWIWTEWTFALRWKMVLTLKPY
jgi:hypothetical protein